MFGACTSESTSEREDWDSGAGATRTEQQQQNESLDAAQDPVLPPGQGVNTPGTRQPF